MKCQHCQKNVDIPFKCPFCHGYFCADHRLPENHACSEFWEVRTRQPPPIEEYHQPPTEEKPEPASGYPPRLQTAGWTSSTEIIHLTVGALLVMAVGLSMHDGDFEWIFLVLREPKILVGSALVFTFIFVSHELAHKAAAKHYGLWAEFRLSLMGAVFTLISTALTLIKFVSPGSVMIVGPADKKIVGITALAGPFTSIVLSSLFFILHFFLPDSLSAAIILGGASLATWIAFLNLIPFNILDGAKVIWWSKPVWAASFSASTILMLVVMRSSLWA